MIRYAKGAPPPRLTALSTTPGMTWAGLGAGDRDPIRAALVRDQGGLCAYCQRRITSDVDASTGRAKMKIEHWIPRTISPDHHLIWSNLLGVCTGSSPELPSAPSSPAGRITQHCDTSRGDRSLFLHPVDGQGPDPREYLQYTKGGQVQAVGANTRVDEDIRTLNLNASRLSRGRKAIFEALWTQLERSEFSTSELRRMARAHRVIAGTTVPEHAEFVRYHVLKKLRGRGESE